MTQVRNNENRFDGQYMIQDRDHMSDITPAKNKTGDARTQQADQSQTESRQQGGDRSSTGKGQRQSH